MPIFSDMVQKIVNDLLPQGGDVTHGAVTSKKSGYAVEVIVWCDT
jgi:hypothetical protein